MIATPASVADVPPTIFRANSSRARPVFSGATTEVNCRPATSPTIRRATGLTQRMMPFTSIR